MTDAPVIDPTTATGEEIAQFTIIWSGAPDMRWGPWITAASSPPS
jgi:hypothetical protein